MSSKRVLYEVDVERITLASAVVTVYAVSKKDALAEAHREVAGQHFATDKVSYQQHDVRVKTEIDLPPLSAEAAYRAYVLRCAMDDVFDISTLEGFDSWQQQRAVSELVDFYSMYSGDSDNDSLEELIHRIYSENASEVLNSGLYGQIEEIYQCYGWEATRAHLISMLGPMKETEDWTDKTEGEPNAN